MSKVTAIKSADPRSKPPGQYERLLAEATALLECTIESLCNTNSHSNDNPDLCDLAAVEKTKAILMRFCNAAEAISSDKYDGMDALSLVELARIALNAGPDSHEGGDILAYPLSISEALVAARDRLQRGPLLEVANG